MRRAWRGQKPIITSYPTNAQIADGGSQRARLLWVKARVPNGSLVLDVGCNCGQTEKELTLEKGCECVGVDVDPQFVEHCQTMAEQVGSYIVADMGRFSDATVARILTASRGRQFDVVLALEVLEHAVGLRDLRRYVQRLLRLGGMFIVTTPAPSQTTWGMVRKWTIDELDTTHHVRMWTPWRLEQVFGEADEIEMVPSPALPTLAATFTMGVVFRKGA